MGIGASALQSHLGDFSRLRVLIGELEGCLPPGEGPKPTKLLGDLHLLLEGHFEYEEDGGYFERALEHAPWLTARAMARPSAPAIGSSPAA